MEIVCVKKTEIDDDEAREIFVERDRAKESKRFDRISKECKECFEALVSISGIIGLRFHRQMILGHVADNEIMIWKDKYVLRVGSTAVEVMQDVTIPNEFYEDFKKSWGLLQNSKIKPSDSSRLFEWLMRAWNENNPSAKFIYFYIALEIVVSIAGVDAKKRMLEKVKYDEEDADYAELIKKKLSGFNPPIWARFRVLAQEWNMPEWKGDAEAFREFASRRNKMLHDGESNSVELVTLKNGEIRRIDDLAERYTNRCIFGDERVYESRWRLIKIEKA